MKTDTICREPLCDDAHERPRFFPRQLITPDDLNLVLEYFRNKLRRHNRLIHGWGVVCGAKVCPIMNSEGSSTEPWKVRVTPGYLLGPYGDEILIDCERTVDLRTRGVNGVTGEPCVEAPDPWCSEVFVPCEETGSRYIAVKYKEMMSRPVRVQPAECGCDDTQCEYSRWKDGYEIGILTQCPESHEGEPPDNERLFSGPIPECPPCPSEPWVVLAKVKIGEDGTIQTIDNCSCRRLVISFGHFWWKCEGGEVTIDSVKLDGSELKTLTQGEAYEGITIKGKNFQQGAKVSLGEGVTVEDVSVNKNKKELTFSATVIDAEPGKRSLIVINPDCSVGLKEIEIKAAAGKS
jgi:hypothetical protein